MDKVRLVIGTDCQCDIMVEGLNLGEVHGYIYASDDMLCLELLPGRTAFLNGNEVAGKFWLQSGDELMIGKSRLDLLRIADALGLSDSFAGSGGLSGQESEGDAVTIKRNWCPFVICILVVLGVGYYFYRVNRSYKEQVGEEKRKIEIQDSIRQAQADSIAMMSSKLDSINKLIIEMNPKKGK